MKRSTLRSRRSRAGVTLVALAAGALTLVTTAAPQAQQQTPRFEEATGVTLVLVDVVVRDRNNNVVRDLTQKDFAISEEGKVQKIESFQFKDVETAAENLATEVTVLNGLEDKLRAEVKHAASATVDVAVAAPADAPDAESLNNRRMIVLLFDVSSMQQEDIERAADSGVKYVEETMAPSDLVALVTIGSRLNVLTDFTSDKDVLYDSLQALANPDYVPASTISVETAATDEAAATETTSTATEADAFEEFNNDVRLRAIKTLCETLTPISQKKAVLYFSSGMQRSGEDNGIEVRAATNTCNRGNVSLYPVDARGLQAVVAGGGVTSRSSGQSLFTGRGASQSFQQLSASQGTLTTLAADTGGRSFTDSNDFGKAFTQVQRDLAAYYLLGYTSTNPAEDGKYRRIQVRLVNRPGLKIDTVRDGYYARRNFNNTNRKDREAMLTDQLSAPVSSTDVPMVVGTGWFRQTGDRFFVPIAMVIPGSSIPVPQGAAKVSLDVRGVVKDEQGRTVAPIKGTLEVPSAGADTLAGKQVLYQTSVILPPGRFWVKMVVRENTGGAVGSFEAPIYIQPPRDNQGLKVSSVVLSTQVQKAPEGKSDNPLIRDGVQLVPNLTRAVARNQAMYFYYEVYDPAIADATAPQVRTSLAFYRGKVKVFETAIVEKTMMDEPSRRAVIFKFEVPADSLKPGTYECQINIIDTVAPSVSFPRLSFMVM